MHQKTKQPPPRPLDQHQTLYLLKFISVFENILLFIMKAMFAVQLRTTLGKFHKTSHEIHLEYVYVSKCLHSFQSGSTRMKLQILELRSKKV